MARSEPVPTPQPQAVCHFCGRLFTNRQAVRAHLRACQAYRDRHVNEQIARIVRNFGGSRQEADEARRGGQPGGALCHFCGRVDFKNGQAVRAHLQACKAYRARPRKRPVKRR